ncbi:hypothetical protein U1Q18_035753 [Sarracenia purpurea var. burkii]
MKLLLCVQPWPAKPIWFIFYDGGSVLVFTIVFLILGNYRSLGLVWLLLLQLRGVQFMFFPVECSSCCCLSQTFGFCVGCASSGCCLVAVCRRPAAAVWPLVSFPISCCFCCFLACEAMLFIGF